MQTPEQSFNSLQSKKKWSNGWTGNLAKPSPLCLVKRTCKKIEQISTLFFMYNWMLGTLEVARFDEAGQDSILKEQLREPPLAAWSVWHSGLRIKLQDTNHLHFLDSMFGFIYSIDNETIPSSPPPTFRKRSRAKDACFSPYLSENGVLSNPLDLAFRLRFVGLYATLESLTWTPFCPHRTSIWVNVNFKLSSVFFISGWKRGTVSCPRLSIMFSFTVYLFIANILLPVESKVR